MKLARKLQLAYLSLMLIPVLIMGILISLAYYSGTSTLGPYSDMDAPGWIKAELAAILESDWDRYNTQKEKVIFFVMDADGFLVFPRFSAGGLTPEQYPFRPQPPADSDSGSGELLLPGSILSRQGVPPPGMAEVFSRFGTDWTLDLTFTPVTVNESRYLVGWDTPKTGIPGFFARRGWMMPLLFLAGVLLIPAFIDARLRRSITRLQEASSRLASGDLDEPIAVLKRDDLSDLAATLEKTRLELKDSRDRKARFLMAVSHDLRTPLTSILGYIEALGDGMAATPEEKERYLSIIGEKAGLLGIRIDELIEFARSETGGWTRPHQMLDPVEFFGNLDASFSKDCGFHGRRYQAVIHVPEGAVLKGDAPALFRAWENLLSNAIRHGGEGDSVIFRVGLVDEGYRALFGEIEDSGPGVPSEFEDRLFEPFARADRGRNAAGLGLGLASVKSVAEAHGGSVAYKPAGARGSVFRIEIPLAED